MDPAAAAAAPIAPPPPLHLPRLLLPCRYPCHLLPCRHQSRQGGTSSGPPAWGGRTGFRKTSASCDPIAPRRRCLLPKEEGFAASGLHKVEEEQGCCRGDLHVGAHPGTTWGLEITGPAPRADTDQNAADRTHSRGQGGPDVDGVPVEPCICCFGRRSSSGGLVVGQAVVALVQGADELLMMPNYMHVQFSPITSNFGNA
ncbi:unnamed protein product [Urochloa humidicola]